MILRNNSGPWTLLLLLLLLLEQVCAQGIPGLQSSRKKPKVESHNRWAVVVGVSKYKHLPKKSWLWSCDKDAQAIADFLQSPRGGSLPSTQLKLLLNEEASARNIRVALDFVITRSAPGDVITLFYAGHGKVRPYGSGDAAYLMAYDSEPEYLNATAIPMDEVHRYVDVHLRRASQVVLVTDACHAGAIVPTSDRSTWKPRGLSEYLQGIGERDGVLNLMACRRNEVAYEDRRLGGHGVLTYALLRALSGEGNATRGGTVRVQDVLEYVSFHVPRLTNQKQHPRYSSNYTDEFPLADLNKQGPDLQLPEPPGSRLESGNNHTDFKNRNRGVTLKVVGAPRMSELYLVKDGEQRTIGRVLNPTNVLVTENLPSGDYTLVQLDQRGQEKSWPLRLTGRQSTFDIRKERLE